ncbi:MoaD/ThiS family protein [Desulfoscipio geothermicus]|uniref:ThiS family protein n=1 Tax=Desulfoscipio geothermicus DSM 3669 TaxID=1121426 RepID=A0A1I6CXX7_9FIRM|nr:hypothetical protein [Desulfoscipio geothermicus]SFQ98064.1 hypothetical protein SAMN05660706_10338 [Desulfoscipio geothermicus DSM 3669]
MKLTEWLASCCTYYQTENQLKGGIAINFTITVDLGIALARQVADEGYQKPKLTLQLQEQITLRQLVNRLGIPAKYISFFTINGEMCGWDATITPNAHIIIYPYITGG